MWPSETKFNDLGLKRTSLRRSQNSPGRVALWGLLVHSRRGHSRPGLARLGPARPGQAGISSPRFDHPGLGSARLCSARHHTPILSTHPTPYAPPSPGNILYVFYGGPSKSVYWTACLQQNRTFCRKLRRRKIQIRGGSVTCWGWSWGRLWPSRLGSAWLKLGSPRLGSA